MKTIPSAHLRSALRDRTFVQALFAELIGTMLFTILASAASNGPLETAFSFAAVGK